MAAGAALSIGSHCGFFTPMAIDTVGGLIFLGELAFLEEAGRMIRTLCTPSAIAFLSASILLVSLAALPAQAAASDDDSEQAPQLVVMADFNHDGIADMAKISPPTGEPSRPRSLIILLGQADGSFKSADADPPLGPDPQAVVVGDFNRDGNPDVIVGDADGSLMEFLGDGKGNLISNGDITRFASVVSIAVGDFNHDGSLDLAVSDSKSNTVTILLGEGKGSFRSAWSFRLPMQGRIFRLAAADFNSDGLPDLAVTSDDDDSFEVMLGNGNGTFTSSPTLSRLKDPNAHCVT